MDPNAVLGPVDPQLGDSPAASVLSVLERKKPEDIDDDLLSDKMAADQATVLAAKLSTGVWTHDYGITAEEAKSLGLPVSTEMPEEVYQFMNLFPQPTRTRPSVEYVPLPYRGRQDPNSGG
jgi:ClpP class serine protease